jgi:hypothetical protein
VTWLRSTTPGGARYLRRAGWQLVPAFDVWVISGPGIKTRGVASLSQACADADIPVPEAADVEWVRGVWS